MNTNTTKDTTKRKRVVRFFYDPATEESWLQDMADKGWAFEKAHHILYTFRQCTPNTYIVKTALAGNFHEKAAIEEMLVDSGATICPIFYNPFPWIYAIRDKSLGDFEINSTADSKARSDLLWLKKLQSVLVVAIAAITVGILAELIGLSLKNPPSWPSTLLGFGAGLATGWTIVYIPLRMRIRKRVKGYKDDSGIYVT